MKHTFNTKIQKLTPYLPDSTKSVSNAQIIEPDDEATMEKKGTLYVVFDLTDRIPVDSLLVTKIVHDVLRDSYYQSENASPLQALEKAVVSVRDKVVKLSHEKTPAEQPKFNILAVVLWGNVLYLVQFGSGGCFLMRANDLRPINTATEGSFSVASGVVKDGDVIIAATTPFLGKYAPQQLINTAVPISPHDLSADSSALVLKFEVDTSFSESEVVSFNSEYADLPTKDKSRRKSPWLAGIKIKSAQSRKIKKPLLLIIPVITILLGTSVYFTLQQNKKKVREDLVRNVVEKARKTLNEVSKKERPPLEKVEELKEAKKALEAVDRESVEGVKELKKTLEEKIAEAQGLVKAPSKVFYDLKLVREDASPTELAVLNGRIVVSDKASGAVYVSSVATPKFEAEKSLFPGISSIAYHGGDLAFVDGEGFKLYSVASGEVVESYAKAGLGVAATYLDFVYGVSGDAITKYTKSGGVLVGSVWAKDGALEKAAAMAIDGSIYVLKNTGELLEFFRGNNMNLKLSDLAVPLSSPVDVVADSELENIYIADAGNERVVIVDKDGKLVKQLVVTDSSWSDIRSVGVARDEKKLYVLSGTKVYEVEL
ncbi:hypothetical protein HYW61_01830 [candidate division WWE3 bacterium]|nr:hypothetical protein [candidate division WWE3 bacterium]